MTPNAEPQGGATRHYHHQTSMPVSLRKTETAGKTRNTMEAEAVEAEKTFVDPWASETATSIWLQML